MYVANELARSNAYYGAWALDAGAPELPLAAAAARVAATEAFTWRRRKTSRPMAASASPGQWTATCSTAARSILALVIGGRAVSGRNRLVDAARNRATRPEEETDHGLQRHARRSRLPRRGAALLEANAEPQGRHAGRSAPERHRRRRAEAPRPGRRRRPMPVSPASPGRSNGAGARRRPSCR